MLALSRTCFIVLIVGFLVLMGGRNSFAQEPKKENKGSITGRVTHEGKPVSRVTVSLTSGDRYMNPFQSGQAVRATTDEDGRYRFNGVAAGSYGVVPNTPAFVVSEESMGLPGQRVSLLEGEDLEDIDFSLKSGGVITGRVTDADGKPIINGRVSLMQVNESGRGPERLYSNAVKFMTDDRGVYRIYGLQPGRYRVSVGEEYDGRLMRAAITGVNYSRTFHPGVSDAAKSPIVEVTAGIDATGIDITVGRKLKTYAAAGRIIDAETGAPLSDVSIGYGSLHDQKHIMQLGMVNNRTNSNSEFRIEGLPPGRFAAYLAGEEASESYSEPSVFEVVDSDVSGLEVRIRRGSSISGVAVIEGTDDADVLAKLSKLDIRAWVQSESVSLPSFAPAKPGTNGTFRIGGLQPGKVNVTIDGDPPIKGLSLLLVERDGIEQPQGIDISAGEQISGIRLVIGYGTGIIRGQVKFQGAERPPNLRMFAAVRRAGGTMTTGVAEVDSRGRFRVEALASGEYTVTLMGNWVQPGNGRTPPPTTQNVTVVSGSEVEVTLVMNLKPTGKDGEK